MTNADAPITPIEAMIRAIPLFADLPDGDIRALCAASRRVSVAAGETIIREGEPGDALYVVLSGELEVSKGVDAPVVLATRRAGEILGEMSVLERTPRAASVSALTESQLLMIDAAAFQHVLEGNPRIATTILQTVAGRLRSTEASLMQREKLASLGTLAAGLAHELNNPAAAIQRSSTYLREVLDEIGRLAAAVDILPLSEGERGALADFDASVVGAMSRPYTAAEEDALMVCLKAREVPSPWDVAPGFAAHGWTPDALDRLIASFSDPHRDAVLALLGARLSARQLADEIQRSGKAISDIVRAVKSYAYLDQAAIQPVEIAQSLEDTLMILKHKLKDGIGVIREFEADLPRVEAYAGELNQVWTNLIDNAADAMDGRGTLTLTARRAGEGVEVQIADDGPGIPPEVEARMFDPFFTTKAQGAGTGLGLHIAHNIVVNRHHGTIAVETGPSGTAFRVRLPLALRR